VNGIHYTPELTLPWESTSEEDRLYRQVLGVALAVLLVLSITLPLLPLQEIIAKVQDEPPPLTRVKLEKKVLEKEVLPTPKPRPRPVPVKPRPKKEIVEAVPNPTPNPNPTAEEQLARARDKAATAGVLAFQDDLQALRDTVDVDSLSSTQTSRGAENAAQVQRNLVTQNSPTSSGGIQTARLSTDTGGAALSGRETTAVTSKIGGGEGVARTGNQSGNGTPITGGRSDDAIRRIMDENKGAIFALYNRALRQDPLLEGKVVFEMVIDPGGQVIELNLLSSDLVDDVLTRKILSRIRLIRFGEDDGLPTRVNYSFDFLPYT
jgi:protein TonB